MNQVVLVLVLVFYVQSLLGQNGIYPKILFSNRDQMAILDPNPDNFTVIASGISRAIAVDYHKTKEYVYWTDVADSRIYRLKYPGGDTIETVISDPSRVQTPDGIAIDPENDHLYWTDTGIDKVLRANLDGTDVTVILDTELEEPRAIVIDTTNSWMYLSDWGNSPKIEKCKLDGSSRQTIVNTGLLWPNGLALDMKEEKLYWADAGMDQIKSANLDGTDVTMILENSTLLIHPFDIDVYGGHIYYADWYTGLMRVSKIPNSIPESLSETLVSPMGLKVFEGVDIPSNAFNVTVASSLEEGSIPSQIMETITFNIEPVFKCNFEPEPDQNYLYDISWYINGNMVTNFEKITSNNIQTTWLRPSHWVGDYHMNMYVRCSVSARFGSDGDLSPRQYSPDFTAGVIPERYVYEVTESGNITITLTSTVPVGCIGRMFINICKETFKISYPKYTKQLETCDGQTENGDLALDRETCGLVVLGEKWYENNDIIVHGYVDSLYNTNAVRTTNVHFIHQPSDKDRSGAWNKVEIPKIQIHIKDEDTYIELSKCESWSDPRYYTFDRKYFSKALSGEYVLYRHKRDRYWVHTLSTACWDGTCNAGIAIRSHNSLFVVRTSDVVSHNTVINGRDHPYVNYRHCDDQNMVVRRHGNQYTITFPSGTEVWFKIGKGISGFQGYWIWHITIKPSTLDIEQTEGLCGYLSRDNNPNDDFRQKGSENVVDLETFINSWSIPENSEESLFTAEPEILNEDYLQPFCICAATVSDTYSQIESGYNEVKCNLSQPLERCLSKTTNLETPFYSSCSSPRQKRDASKTEFKSSRTLKRNVDDPDDLVENPELIYANDFIPNYFRPDPTWKNGWTTEKAREACRLGFNSNPELRTCKEYIFLQTEEYLTSCIEDIKASGNTKLMQLTIDKMLSACVIEISRNQSLTNDTDSEGISSAKIIIKLLCSNNCSNQGQCDDGICICKKGYSGDDCSYKSKASISRLYIADEGRCGTRQRQCKKTNVYGDFQTAEIWYRRNHFQIIDFLEQRSKFSEILKAEYRSPYMVTCDLQSGRRKRDASTNVIAQGYYLSFSGDGVVFGEENVVIIYDEECYSCNTTTVSCSALDSCPHSNSTTSSKISTDSNKKKTLIIVGVFVSCLVLCAIFIVLLCIKYKTSKSEISNTNYQVDSFEDDEYYKYGNVQNVPPVKQSLPTHNGLIREKTAVSLFSIDLYSNRTRTPVELFTVYQN